MRAGSSDSTEAGLVPPVRYRSHDEDSAHWLDFPFRSGDIVISTRSKSGTTWVQMMCALLVFQTPQLPSKLSTLSPWLDWLVNPRDDVMYAHLSAQAHRRFIKTHTPLDGLPAMNGLPTSSWLGIHWTWRFHSTTRGTTSTGSDSGS